MKRKLLLIPVLLIVFLLSATPIFADDMEVDVTIVTPGDIDLDVGINAGGDVDITIDGVDFKDTAATAQEALAAATYMQPTDFMGDWVQYWTITGLGSRVDAQIEELQGVVGLIANAEAKLIQGQALTGEEIAGINRALGHIKVANDASQKEINAAIEDGKAQNKVTWNQLMYGAEHDIVLIYGKIAEQETRIVELQERDSTLSAELEDANSNLIAVSNYTNYLQKQYLYYSWILGGAIVALAILLLVSHLRKRS